MMNFPCENCITLAACLGRLSNRHIEKNNIYRLIIEILARKCSILYEYIDPDEPLHYNLDHRNKTRNFFLNKFTKKLLY